MHITFLKQIADIGRLKHRYCLVYHRIQQLKVIFTHKILPKYFILSDSIDISVFSSSLSSRNRRESSTYKTY